MLLHKFHNHMNFSYYRMLENNNISGQLPAEIGKLSKLISLDLSNNHFSGSIPKSMGQLISLSYL